MIAERNYLDTKIMPALMQALEQTADQKPANPIEFIARYMLR